MLVKIIIVFLGFMALVGMIGSALLPSRMPRVLRKGRKAPFCSNCGRPRIGSKPCDCESKAAGGKAK